MQAILTKFIPATNTKGDRIKAICKRGSLTVEYPEHLEAPEKTHRFAVDSLIAKFIKEDAKNGNKNRNPWATPYVTGGLPGNMGYAHVFVTYDTVTAKSPVGWDKIEC
jgi:hypothetical protein